MAFLAAFFFADFSSGIFGRRSLATFADGVCERYFLVMFSQVLSKRGSPEKVPGTVSLKWYRKVPPEKRFAGMPLATASGTSFHKASSGNVSGACF